VSAPPTIHLRTRTDDQSKVDIATSHFKSSDIDELLGAVRSSSDRVRIYAEEIMDNILVSAHQTIHINHKMSKDIHKVTQKTEEEVWELRGKIDEILNRQKSFQTALDAVSSKNSLVSFLMEYLSKSKPATVLGGYAIFTYLKKNLSNVMKRSHQRSLRRPPTSQ
jgi:hypothetical protein